MTRPLNSDCGFSLPETLSVLALAGVSLSLAVPGYRMLVRGDQDATAVNQLVTTMQLARSTAVSRNVRVTVCPSASGERCDNAHWQDGWIAFTDAGPDRQMDSPGTVLTRQGGQPGLTVSSPEFSQSFSYRPNGQVVATVSNANSGSFIFCRGDAGTATRVVIVPPSGEPRVAQTFVDGTPPACPHQDRS